MLLLFSRHIHRYLVLFSIIGLLFSQQASITGVVISDNDQTPIHGANIYIKKLDVGTASRVDGTFILDDLPNDSLSLTISMIGFKDVSKTINLAQKNNDIGQVLMITDAVEMQEIHVDAHQELEPKRFSSNIYISGNKFHSSVKSSLALTLEEETGLAIRSMGQGTTQPVLRGYSGDRFLLTEDGITSGDLSNSSVDHTVSMDMLAYNRVKIVRGPEALLYGSNTIGGVIDVSRQIDPGVRFKNISLQAVIGTETSNSSLFGNIVSYLPINEKHQVRLSLLNRNAGNQISPIGILDNTELTNKEVTAGYSYFGKESRSTISYEYLKMDYGIPGSPEGHISGVDIDLYKHSQKYNYHRDISFMGFQTLDIDQRFINYGHKEFEKGISYPTIKMIQRIFSIQNNLKSPQLNLGSLFQYRQFEAGGFYWTPDTDEISMALFGLYERELMNFIVQFSSRFEYQMVVPDVSALAVSNLNSTDISQRNFPLFSTGMSMFRTLKNWEFSFATMLTGRSPGIEDLYSDGPHLGTYAYEIGQPTLNLEQTIGVEASIEHKTDNSEMRLTGYQNYSPNYHISAKMGQCEEEFLNLQESHPCAGADFIAWGQGSSGWLYKYQMSEVSSSIYGIESEFTLNLTKMINIFGSVSVIRGENLSDETPLAYVPADKLLFSTEVDLNPLSAALTFKKVFPQKRLGEFEEETSGYFLVDLDGSYIFNKSKNIHKISFRIDNIFDQEYYNHLSRIKSIMPEKGRSFGIQYRFIF